MAVRPALLWATVPGRTKRLASLVICFSRLAVVPHAFLPFDTWPTWAYPVHYRPALAFSAFSMLSPLPCLTVGAATHRVARSNGLSMFCIRYRMDLGPLCYTGSLLSSRRVTLDNPDSTACPFGWSLNQPRMAPCSYSAYERLVSFDPVLRLWLSPGLRLPGLIHFREGSTPLAVAPKAFGAARQAHASVEYLRRHAGLGQDCSAKQ